MHRISTIYTVYVGHPVRRVDLDLAQMVWVAHRIVLLLVAMGLAGAFLYLNPQIPEISSFTNVALKAPLRILSSDNRLIQEYGERLMPIRYEDIPPQFINAILDTEDKRFFEHGGIDLITLLNASWQLVANAGEIKTGASTITMQLVKNISGDSQVRFIRKFREMLLAIKLERQLTKQEILTLYLNMIPFGKHAYGIQAAAYTYYDKDISELNLAQTAMLRASQKHPRRAIPSMGHRERSHGGTSSLSACWNRDPSPNLNLMKRDEHPLLPRYTVGRSNSRPSMLQNKSAPIFLNALVGRPTPLD